MIDLTDLDRRIAGITELDNLKLIYAFILTFPGSPVITYGDEIGLTEGKLLNMGSFNWNSEKQNRILFNQITTLLSIRKKNPGLKGKNFFTLYVNDINHVYAYDRGGIIVIINSGEAQSFVTLGAWNGTYTDQITGEKYSVANQQLRLSIPAKSYRIIRREF